MVATGVGLIFLALGVLGFVPDATREDALQLAEPGASVMLFGVFRVAALDNLVHLLFGLAGLAMSRTVLGARTFLILGGAIYLAIWRYGASAGWRGWLSLIPVHDAGDWLYLGLGGGMILLGALTPRGRDRA
jgi:hypothetical protein